jgi:hypothetical protein
MDDMTFVGEHRKGYREVMYDVSVIAVEHLTLNLNDSWFPVQLKFSFVQSNEIMQSSCMNMLEDNSR